MLTELLLVCDLMESVNSYHDWELVSDVQTFSLTSGLYLQ